MSKKSEKKKQELLVSSYLNDLGESRVKDDNSSWWYRRYDPEKLVENFSKLDSASFRKLVSYPGWNRYPTYTYNRTGSDRSHGSAIGQSITTVCRAIPGMKDILISHSEGLFLVYTLDSLRGKDRVKVARRAIKSKDSRARLRAAKILPVTQVKRLLNDKVASVRNAAIKRIGIDNCANDLMGDSSEWIRRHAIEHSTLSKEESKVMLEDTMKHHMETKRNGGYISWSMRANIENLIGRVDNHDILFYLDMADIDDHVREMIKVKVENLDWS